jgi:putative transposase
MPYRYQTLTQEERERILLERKARRFPLHAPPHLMRDEGTYMITGVNFGHKPIMFSAERRSDFEARLIEKLQEIQARIYGWVILPNHYHGLWSVDKMDSLSRALKQLHGQTSREWNLLDHLVGKRQVWYRFSDRKIRGEDHFYRALNYIHFNPVKHGYVDSVYDWPWSSVHNYLEDWGRDWLREYWKRFRPDRMGKDWDD